MHDETLKHSVYIPPLMWEARFHTHKTQKAILYFCIL